MSVKYTGARAYRAERAAGRGSGSVADRLNLTG
jgi:hypothetical protein